MYTLQLIHCIDGRQPHVNVRSENLMVLLSLLCMTSLSALLLKSVLGCCTAGLCEFDESVAGATA